MTLKPLRRASFHCDLQLIAVNINTEKERKILVNVIGLGYIGLPTALMLAVHGTEVVGTDKKEEIVRRLSAGQITFEEKGIEDLYRRALKSGIQFSTNYQKAKMYIIAVPTPYDAESKKIDPSYVLSAVESVAKVCESGATIIIESTVSPGTIDRTVRDYLEGIGLIVGKDIHLVHAPERIIPGNMIYELENNSRTIGADEPDIAAGAKNLYKTFCRGEIVTTDIRTAEMTKVVENTFRDINIAFANELAKICRSGDMNVYEIIRIANKHPRVSILQPGPGVGGHCIAVDPWFLVGDYPGLANIILAARKINDSMPEFVLERVHSIMDLEGVADSARVGFYGLAYKENVDDVRESPTLQLIDAMKRHLAPSPKVYDPYIQVDIVENQYHDFQAFLDDIDVVVVMVGHSEIIAKQELLSKKIVLDTKNVIHGERVHKL